MPLGTFITTATVRLCATGSSTMTHGLGAAPDFVWATQKQNALSLTNSQNVGFCAGGLANTASITVFNRGRLAGTWTVCMARFHSIIK